MATSGWAPKVDLFPVFPRSPVQLLKARWFLLKKLKLVYLSQISMPLPWPTPFGSSKNERLVHTSLKFSGCFYGGTCCWRQPLMCTKKCICSYIKVEINAGQELTAIVIGGISKHFYFPLHKQKRKYISQIQHCRPFGPLSSKSSF